MQAIHSLRQRLRGKNPTLDKTLSQLANDAQKNVVQVHSGARQKVQEVLSMLTGANSPSTARARSALASTLKAGLKNLGGDVEKAVNLIEQLTPQLFGGTAKTPEQAGGTRVDTQPEQRRIVPAEPATWHGMRLVSNDIVEIVTPSFRGRYNIKDPAVTGEMVPVTSSNVHSIGFQFNLKNPLKSTLLVRYLQGQKNSKTMGPLYGYADVHPKLFDQFMRAQSKGIFVWDELRIRGTIAGHQYAYTLLQAVGGNVPRRAILVNGIQILKRRVRQAKDGRVGVSKLQTEVKGPYKPTSNRPNRGNPDRGSQRPNRGR